MSEKLSKLMEEYEQMVNARIIEMNKKGLGATDEFREARKKHDELRQLIESSAQEPDEAEVGEFIGEQAHLFKRQWPDRFYGDGSIDFYVFDNLKKVLKAYDELRRG